MDLVKKNFKIVTFEDFLFTKVDFEIILDNSPHGKVCPEVDVHEVGGPYFHRLWNRIGGGSYPNMMMGG